jgi:hypothetical protein
MTQSPAEDTNRRRVARRAAFGLWASGLASLASSCGTPGLTEIDTPDGKVLQLEKDDFLILVSDFAQTYHPGDTIKVHVIVNNQSNRFAQTRIRTKLVGKGQQVVAEAEAAMINIKPSDATAIDRSFLIPNDLPLGDYTLQVELPFWSFEGRQTGGATLSTGVKLVG